MHFLNILMSVLFCCSDHKCVTRFHKQVKIFHYSITKHCLTIYSLGHFKNYIESILQELGAIHMCLIPSRLWQKDSL